MARGFLLNNKCDNSIFARFEVLISALTLNLRAFQTPQRRKMKFVRSSKYRHVYGTAYKRDQCYENIRVSRNAWDTNLCKVNGHFLSVNLEASGGGQFMVIPLEMTGKLPSDFPVFAGHTAAVLDTDFNPFNDCKLFG
jgi:hypothetical protein